MCMNIGDGRLEAEGENSWLTNIVILSSISRASLTAESTLICTGQANNLCVQVLSLLR